MFKFRRARVAAVAAFVLALGVGKAAAATCTDPIIDGTGWFVVDTSPASSCIGVGKGDISLPSIYTLLDKSDDLISGVFAATSPLASGDFVADSATDTFTIGAIPGYTSIVLVIKDGNLGPLPPPFSDDKLQWGAFLLGALTGVWEIRNADGTLRSALSHASLYGIECTSETCPKPPGGSDEVPLPPAMLLFASALAGMGLLGIRRRRRT